MKVKYSKYFEKAVRKLSGKRLESVRDCIKEVKKAKSIDEITDCIKLVDYDYIYRIHIGSYRAFFNFHVEIKDDIVYFFLECNSCSYNLTILATYCYVMKHPKT